LVEAAVRNTILQLRGIDTLKEFIERQRVQMITESEEPKIQGRLI
jgi:HPr kinase/phosphorylase